MKTVVNLLKKQTNDSINWTNKLIENISPEQWFKSSEIIETNLAWQIGHLTLSNYYYGVVLVNGLDEEFSDIIGTKKYRELFAKNNNRDDLNSIVTVQEIQDNWKLLIQKTNETIETLMDRNLAEPIFAMHKPHPFVKTIEDSLSWNIKHTMWHCGQIATHSRIIGSPFDLGM